MTSRLPALNNLPSIVRKAAAAYTEGAALLDKLDQDLGAVCGMGPQEQARNADEVLMLDAISKGEDPVLIGTPNEAARRAREVYGRKAAEAQRAHVGRLEHDLGLLLLEHRDAAIAHVDPAIDPVADAYREAIEAMFTARSAFEAAMGLRGWAVSISHRDLVPHLGDSEMGPRILVGMSDVNPGDLRAALRVDANRAPKSREAEAARSVVLARTAAREAITAAEAAARTAVEEAAFDSETGKVIPRQPVAA